MDSISKQQLIPIPAINKSIMVYEYGNSTKSAFSSRLVRSRNATFKIADTLLKEGYATISFDALLTENHLEIQLLWLNLLPPFWIGKTIRAFWNCNRTFIRRNGGIECSKIRIRSSKIAVIGSGDVVQDILDNFISRLQLKPIISQKLRNYFETKYGEVMDNYSAYKAASTLEIPILVIHDKTILKFLLKQECIFTNM